MKIITSTTVITVTIRMKTIILILKMKLIIKQLVQMILKALIVIKIIRKGFISKFNFHQYSTPLVDDGRYISQLFILVFIPILRSVSGL